MATTTQLRPAAHRQTRYAAAPPIDPPVAMPIPKPTDDLAQAVDDITNYGLCLLADALDADTVSRLRDRLDRQAAAERGLGALAPAGANDTKQLISALVNKGPEFLALVERPEVDALAGHLLGKDFLISSITGGVFHGSTSEPQVLHRDQGQVPATADFPAACNMFWMLDDFTADRGSTCVVPGSHRWPPEYQVEPPPRDMAVQIEAPAGTLFAWDGRIWHGTGVNREGHPRRQIATFFCLPWMRQQENWRVSCLQEVLDDASPKLRVRLGLKTYGTLGGISGTATGDDRSLGNNTVTIPDYVIGENATLHPIRRVSRAETETPRD